MLPTSQRKSVRPAKSRKASTPFAKAYAPLVRHLTPSQLTVWLAIKLHDRQEKGEAYPGQETIARETGLGLRTVREVTRQLDEVGALAREPRGRNRYRYLFFDIPTDWTPRTAAPADSAGDLPLRPADIAGLDRQILPERPADSAAEVDREKKKKVEIDRMDGTSACGDSPQSGQAAAHFERPGTVQPLEFVDYGQPLADEKQERDSVALADRLDRLRASMLTKVPLTAAQRLQNVKSARILLACDGRTLAEVTGLLDWAYQDSYWSGQIGSLYALRASYGAVREDSLSRKPRQRRANTHGQQRTAAVVEEYRPRHGAFIGKGFASRVRLREARTAEEKALFAEEDARIADEKAMDDDPEYQRIWREVATSGEFDAEEDRTDLIHAEAEKRWQPTMNAEGTTAP